MSYSAKSMNIPKNIFSQKMRIFSFGRNTDILTKSVYSMKFVIKPRRRQDQRHIYFIISFFKRTLPTKQEIIGLYF